MIGMEANQHTLDYHHRLYAEQGLYDEGSWLKEPAEEVMQALQLVPEGAMVLDLGCGVGRHTIPAAQCKNVRGVIGVDCLPIAIDELRRNTRQFGVEDKVVPRLQRIENYPFPPGTFDFILAFSALAHLPGLESFENCLAEIHASMRKTGFALFCIMADVRRYDDEGCPMRAGIEIPFESEELNRRICSQFKVMHRTSTPFEMDEEFEGRSSRMRGYFHHYLVGHRS